MKIPATSLKGEQDQSAMRYFCTRPPPPLLILFFILSFLTLSLSLKTEQVQAMKNIFAWAPHPDPCRWDGVTCSENGGNDVVGLNLSSSYSFQPSVWHYICQLPVLQLLDLSYNDIGGPIPECVGSFPNLTILRLSHNGLSGSIPSRLASLSNLQVLDLSSNQLTGYIPPQLLSLSSLEDLDLSFNHLTWEMPQNFSSSLLSLSMENNYLSGTIPSAISNARNLTHLEMSYNLLIGEISEVLANMSQLFELDLSNNKLTGEIPETLGNMSHLHELNLSNNKLTGEIPEALGNMSQLHELDLSNNKLTGEIPEALGNMSQLHELNLWNNKLTGEIPEALGNMSQLHELDLSNNKLTGKIPEALGNMSHLYRLNLSNNKLTGKIPEALGNMSQLYDLYLSNNKLTGEIPEAIGNMSHLRELDLSNNKLTGEIPKALGNMSQLYELDLSYNKLTGKIPESVRLITGLNLSNNELVYSNELVDSVPTGRSNSTLKILGVVGALVIFIICCLVVGVVWIRNLHSRAEFKETIRKILEKVEHPRISHEELLAATNRFHSSNLLSTSSFGSVYKGFLSDGTRVAVKVLNLMHDQSERIFRAECRVLQKARHRNLARIITTCSTPHFKALVFQYFTNGSLDKHLYLGGCRLGPRKLLNIAIDVAHAVEYLHYDCFVQIVHCDIKPSNVLLDETMTAHLSDYGISRLIGRIAANSVTSTIDLKGSVGYIAPEYGLNGMISPRGDVYSYGILLLEMLTRRRPTDNMFDGDLNLHNWVKRAFPDRAFEAIDESLLMERAGKETEEFLISLMRLGLLCSTDSAEARPNMRQVSNLLKLIQQDFTTDTSSSIKLMPTISNLVCDRCSITNYEEASDTQSSSF